MRKKALLLLLCAALLTGNAAAAAEPIGEDELEIAAPSAILMEKTSGEILYEKNAHEKLLPASVTKIMTLLLVMEALEDGRLTPDTPVTASAHAASMGGSQVWLEEGETMSVEEMLKCVTVASANDCAVALAETLCGTEAAFVAKMNERAQELGMTDTHFCDCTGLMDNPEHLTTAYDIALMSRELLQHEEIKRYSTIWTDSIRDGAFGLSNTNKLLRSYAGATGLKTGFTSQALYCISATAERDGVEYIAVILHAATRDERNASAATLLDYAFAKYALFSPQPSTPLSPVAVQLGKSDFVTVVPAETGSILVKKEALASLCTSVELPESISAPVGEGQQLGTLTVSDEAGGVLAEIPLVAAQSVPRLTMGEIFLSFFSLFD